MSWNQKIGQKGEEIALKYLIQQGYQILERNYRKKVGEIDIIAQQNQPERIVVFVEVKTLIKKKQNLSDDYYLPEDNISFWKRKRLFKTAQWYLKEKGYSLGTNWQIDIIAVELDLEKRKADLRHFKNAVWF